MRLKIAFVLLLTVACLVWVLWGLDLQIVANELSEVQIVWFVPMLALYTLNLLLRTLRFGLLLEQKVPFRGLLSVVAVSFLAINTMPLRLGELVRPYLLLEKFEVPIGGSMAALVLERLLDMAAVATLLLILSWTVDVPQGLMVGGVDLLWAAQSGLGFALAIGGLGAAVLIVGGRPAVEAVERAATRLSPAYGPRAVRPVYSFVDGFRSLLQHPSKALLATTHTVVMWLSAYLAILSVFAAFKGIPVELDLALLNMAGGITGILLLPTPGFFGGFEAGSMAALTLMGVNIDVARTFSVVYHLAILGHVVIVGLLFVLWEGWSMTQIVGNSLSAADGA